MPSSLLESLPGDVLQQIAVLCCSSSVLRPPNDLLHLLLTSRRLYDILSLHARPSSYVVLFRTRFDIDAPLRRYNALGVAEELVHRYQVLRRIRLGEISDQNICADLWTVYLMILESDGMNEKQLEAVDTTKFIVQCIRTYFCHGATQIFDDSHATQIRSLSLWVLWLIISYRHVRSSLVPRSELLNLIHRFSATTLPDFTFTSTPSSPVALPFTSTSRHLVHRRCTIRHFAHDITLLCPDLSSAAILLTCTLKEAVSFPAPPHLPLNRAIAVATGYTGPTAEDYAGLSRCITPLWAETALASDVGLSRSRVQDDDYYRLIPASDLSGQLSFKYTPGMMSGLWEGNLMVSPIPKSSDDFVCRTALQCDLTEYVCFAPHMPIPSTVDLGDDNDSSLDWSISPRKLIRNDDGFEVHSSSGLHHFQYQAYCQKPVHSESRKDPLQALDVIVVGETRPEHDLAWGGYRFSGRVRLRDGFIVLIREPKSESNASFGSWIFEGYVYAGSTFAGRWRSSKIFTHCGLEGIFSLSKRVPEDVRREPRLTS